MSTKPKITDIKKIKQAGKTKSEIIIECVKILWACGIVEKQAMAKLISHHLPDMGSVQTIRKKIIVYANGSKTRRLKPRQGVTELFNMETEPCDIRNRPSDVYLQTGIKRLVIGDLHALYYDKKALNIAFQYGMKAGCTELFINGDLLDLRQLGSFTNHPKASSFQKEREWAKEFFKSIPKQFTKIHYKLSNHEDRLDKKMWSKIPELAGIEDFTIEHIFADKRITFYASHSKVWMGKLLVLHGHEIKSGASVNIARSIQLKTYTHTLCHHFHKKSEDIITNAAGKTYIVYVVGCMCETKGVTWLPVNQWQTGFAIVDSKKDDTFLVDNRLIINGEIY